MHAKPWHALRPGSKLYFEFDPEVLALVEALRSRGFLAFLLFLFIPWHSTSIVLSVNLRHVAHFYAFYVTLEYVESKDRPVGVSPPLTL